MKEITDEILGWLYDRDLHESHPHAAYLKFQEEAGELAADIAKGRDPIDSLGDIFVTWVNLCAVHNVWPEEAAMAAYKVIKNRKGKLVNGIFIKEEDLNGEMRT